MKERTTNSHQKKLKLYLLFEYLKKEKRIELLNLMGAKICYSNFLVDVLIHNHQKEALFPS